MFNNDFQNSDTILSKIALNIPGVIYAFQLWEDGRSCFPYASEQIYGIYGVTPDEVKTDASKVFSVLHPEDLEYITETIVISKEQLSIWKAKYRVIHPDKGVIFVEGLSQPEKQDDGSVLWFGYIHDITEQTYKDTLIKEKNLLIQKNQLKYKTLYETSLDGVVLIDPKTQKFIEFNYTAYEMYGYTKEEFLNITTTDLEALQDIEQIKATQKSIIEIGWDRFATVHKTKNGTLKDVVINVRAVNIDDTDLLYATFHDVSTIVEQGRLLESQKNQYEAIFKNSQDPIGIIDFNSKFLKFNDAYTAMLGYEKEELIGKSCMELSIPEDIPRVLTMFDELKEKGFVKNFDKSCYRKDGQIVFVSLSLIILPDHKTILVNAKDLTGKRKILNELMIAKIDAEKATAAQSKFLANMSHEIRTPMNGILGFSKILKESLKNDNNIDYATMIETSAKTLLEIINDILDISKIKSGSIELEKKDFKFYDAMIHTKKLYQIVAKEKGILFETQIDSSLENLIVCSDVTKLKQIISNLLNNALKFTPKNGTVLFKIETINKDEKSIRLRFSVKDTGIGIAPERQQLIFEPFRQENESTTREFGGTGLGLSICKEIVSMLGGELTLVSQKDKGSEFSFEIFFSFGEDVALKKIVKNEKNSFILKVLVAEDVEINQKLFKVLLAQKGVDAIFANNGLELIKIFKNKYQEFDMVFVDINMPVMDGVEAFQEISKFKKQNNIINVPIVALTANVIEGDKKRYLEIGFDDYLSKPIKNEKLNEILERFTKKG
jgi:PAS domain S-box-containing protein